MGDSYHTPVVRFSRDSSLARIDALKQSETPDKLNESVQDFGTFYVICIALSIITYVLDLVLACILLYYYSVYGFGNYFALTLTFLLVPAICMTALSLRWYIIDDDDPALGRTSLTKWAIRILVLLFQLSPLLRYVDTLVYGIQSKIAGATDDDARQTRLYRRMLDEHTNGALLRLIHCFLHSAPQAVVQLMVVLNRVNNPDETVALPIDVEIIQAWTVAAALVSIAWALTSYHRSIRCSRDDKDKMTWTGTLVAFCWHLMSALARILALSFLASILPDWMGYLCAVHWVLMSVWLVVCQYQSAVCSNGCEDFLLSVALGLAYVLAFISPRDGPTRHIYAMYYLVCFMENTGVLVVWCSVSNSHLNPLFRYIAAGTQVVSFVLAMTFLIIYYRYCHPTRKEHTKIPDLSNVVLESERAGKSYTVRTRT